MFLIHFLFLLPLAAQCSLTLSELTTLLLSLVGRFLVMLLYNKVGQRRNLAAQLQVVLCPPLASCVLKYVNSVS